MLMSLCNHQTSLPSKTLPNPSLPYRFFFPRPLPETLFSQNPKKLLKTLHLRISASATTSDTQTLPQSAIRRIAEKLRSLGYVEDNDKEEPKKNVNPNTKLSSPGEIFVPLPTQLPKYRVGHTIDSSWSTPENPVPEPGSGNAIQRYHELRIKVGKEKREEKLKKRAEEREKVPTLAELRIPKEELRRLRAIGIGLKTKLKVGKAGITEGIVNGIHERWRGVELVKIVCEDICRLNMKRTHDLLERKTGGLVIWRSGSNIILYRGAGYKYPYFFSDTKSSKGLSDGDLSRTDRVDDDGQQSYSYSTDIVDSARPNSSNKVAPPPLINGVGSPNRVRFQLPGEAQLAEEADHLLEGLGPRFVDWWGYDPLPVDADLLPAIVQGYRRPFRLLPYGVKPKLTNDEATILRRLGRPLPCHFVLGRNRKLQGLAAAIVKLWEKCEIAKIAVKRGVQNTNSQMMAEELKGLTGGTLLSRDKEFIVFYRGKDFLPAAVSSAIEERRNYEIHSENIRKDDNSSFMHPPDHKLGTLLSASEHKQDKANDHKHKLTPEQKKLRFKEAAIKTTSSKLSIALAKKARAEELLADLEKEEISRQPEIDKEGITEEERYMLRKVGLRMNPFLLLGRRGVFDGTVENMHLHWKYRELVKIISGERNIKEVHGIARKLEVESGGILVAVERVSKGYAIIVYRGKNYKRPACLRPQTLLNKREALKRSIEAQRRESLKLHVLKLSRNIDQFKIQLAKDEETGHMPMIKQLKLELATESHGAGLGNSKDVMDASSDNLQITQQAMPRDFSFENESKEDTEFDMTEPGSLSGSAPKDTNPCMDMKGEGGDVDSVTCPADFETTFSAISNTEPHVHDIKTMESSVDSPKIELKPSVDSAVENGSGGIPFRSAHLSNKERLLLRKQALKMKKRPVLAIGKNNVVSGVAKAIKAHFQKHPLAIVNIKGRAQGTSVQEVIFKLEQATGAVLVSQEPSKVILYRGWESGEEPVSANERNLNKSAGREGGDPAIVSPELISAIRLECGLECS
ncbi:unnamed protein product [Ilex paraguariensis]|uniref:CRM domain-containing protein n=1 Tax=Ilex paraguariensis TaxID=185542 RepID=A0ABC8T073_9AQUA